MSNLTKQEREEAAFLARRVAAKRAAKEMEFAVVEATQAVTDSVTAELKNTGVLNPANVKAMVETWKFCRESDIIFRGSKDVRTDPQVATVEVDWEAVNATIDQVAAGGKRDKHRRAAQQLLAESYANT